MCEPVNLSVPAVFADAERKAAGKTHLFRLIDNGDYVAVLAVRGDGSTSMTVLEVPKADAEEFCAALRRAAGVPSTPMTPLLEDLA